MQRSTLAVAQKLGLQNSQPLRRIVRFRAAVHILILSAVILPCFGQCEDEGVEAALRCSDLVVLGRVVKTFPEGREVRGIIHTVHILKVEEYYLGSGPESIQLLTPGGQWTDSEGKKHYLSISTIGGSDWRTTQDGEEMIASLQREGDAYVFRNSCGSKVRVQKDPESGARQAVIRFHKKEYLRGAALHQYEEAEKRMHSPKEEEVAEARRKLSGAFSEVIPLDQVFVRIKLALIGAKGPNPAQTMCR